MKTKARVVKCWINLVFHEHLAYLHSMGCVVVNSSWRDYSITFPDGVKLIYFTQDVDPNKVSAMHIDDLEIDSDCDETSGVKMLRYRASRIG